MSKFRFFHEYVTSGAKAETLWDSFTQPTHRCMNDTGFESKRTTSKKEGTQEGSSLSEVVDFFKNHGKGSSKSPSSSPNNSPSNSINLSQSSVTMQAARRNSNSSATSSEEASSRKTRLELLHSYFTSSYPTAKQQLTTPSTTTTTETNTSKNTSTTQQQTIEKDKENEESPCASPKQGIGSRLSRKKQQIMKWNRPEKEIKEKEKEPTETEKEDEKPVINEKDPLKYEIQKMKLLLDSLSCRIGQEAEVVDIIQKDIERLQRRKNITTTFMGGTRKRLEALEDQLTNIERQVQTLSGQVEVKSLSVQEFNDVISKLSKAYSQLSVAHSTQATKPVQPAREPVQKEHASVGPVSTRKASLKSSSHVAFELPSPEEEVVENAGTQPSDVFKDLDVKQISGELLTCVESINRLVEKQHSKKRELEEERRKLNSEINQLEKTKTELENAINRKTLQITENEALIAKLSGNFDYSTLSVAELAELLNIVSSSQRKFLTSS